MKILFIGNSYTYFNDMPELFRQECEKNGISAEVDSVTAGGYRLSQFLSEEDEYAKKVRQLLDSKKYDHVVLQGQSVYPITETETFLKCVSEFDHMIKANGAKTVLYETWGRADGNDTLARLGLTHDEMQDKLRAVYKTAAEETGAVLVCAGDRFHEAYRAGIDVFDPDGSHPSLTGSQIIAKEFFRVLMK